MEYTTASSGQDETCISANTMQISDQECYPLLLQFPNPFEKGMPWANLEHPVYSPFHTL